MLVPANITISTFSPAWKPVAVKLIASPAAPEEGLTNNSAMVNALNASDKILVPIQCEFYALEGLSQLINTVKLVRKSLNPKLEVEGVVLTMYDGRTNLSNQVVDEVKSFFKNKVYDTIIPRNVRLSEAPSFGLPIIKYDPKCLGSDMYLDLAKELIKANKGV